MTARTQQEAPPFAARPAVSEVSVAAMSRARVIAWWLAGWSLAYALYRAYYAAGGRFGALGISCVPCFFGRGGAGAAPAAPAALAASLRAASMTCWTSLRCGKALLIASGDTGEGSVPGGVDRGRGGGALLGFGLRSAVVSGLLSRTAAIAGAVDDGAGGGGP